MPKNVSRRLWAFSFHRIISMGNQMAASLKSDFFYRPGDKRHKTQKSKFEIFCPEIAHGMPIHLV